MPEQVRQYIAHKGEIVGMFKVNMGSFIDDSIIPVIIEPEGIRYDISVILGFHGSIYDNCKLCERLNIPYQASTIPFNEHGRIVYPLFTIGHIFVNINDLRRVIETISGNNTNNTALNTSFVEQLELVNQVHSFLEQNIPFLANQGICESCGK